MTKRLVTMLLAATALSGCAMSGAPQPEKQWNTTIGRYDLIPVYPPQEDVLPGDVFLLGVSDPDGTSGRSGWPVRVGHALGAEAALAAVYGARPEIAQAPAKPDAAAPDTFMTIPGKPPVRLRLRDAELPTLTFARYSAVDLGFGGETQGFNIFGALGANSATSVSVSLSGLKALNVDEGRVFSIVDGEALNFLATQFTVGRLIKYLAQKDAALARAFCDTDFAALDRQGIYLVGANEIVYAHDIDYHFTDEKTVAGVAAASLAKAPPSQGGQQGGTTTSDGTPSGNVAALIDSLNKNASQFKNSGGASISFGIGRTGGLTMKTHHDRPLAVGMAGGARFSMGELAAYYLYYYAANGRLATSKGVDSRGTVAADTRSLRESVDNTPFACGIYGADGAPLLTYLTTPGTQPKSYTTGPGRYR